MFLCNLLPLNFVVRMQKRISYDDSSMKVIFWQVFLDHKNSVPPFQSLLNLPERIFQVKLGFGFVLLRVVLLESFHGPSKPQVDLKNITN